MPFKMLNKTLALFLGVLRVHNNKLGGKIFPAEDLKLLTFFEEIGKFQLSLSCAHFLAPNTLKLKRFTLIIWNCAEEYNVENNLFSGAVPTQVGLLTDLGK